MEYNQSEQSVLERAKITVAQYFNRRQLLALINPATKVCSTILLILLIIIKVCIIGGLPTRTDDPNTPRLNQNYAQIPRIAFAFMSVGSIRARQAEGQIVVACSNSPATDADMLLAADYRFLIDSQHPGYPTVTPDEMVQIELWLSCFSCPPIPLSDDVRLLALPL